VPRPPEAKGLHPTRDSDARGTADTAAGELTSKTGGETEFTGVDSYVNVSTIDHLDVIQYVHEEEQHGANR